MSAPVNSFIDHTVLKQTCTLEDVEKVCDEAVTLGFASVCIPPSYVLDARRLVDANGPSMVKVCTVVGFPFGYSCTASKVAEIEGAVKAGADEVDIVANIALIKNGSWTAVEEEIACIMSSSAVTRHQVTLKVIIESGVLSDGEIKGVCEILGKHLRIGDFVKTSTGYADGGKGASESAVRLFRQSLPSHLKIKASGGIRDYATATAMIRAGADRLGCSASVAIAEGNKEGAAASY